jgi:hypothetical protein
MSRTGVQASRGALSRPWRMLTVADKVLIVAVVVGASGLAFHQRLESRSGDELAVEANGQFQGTYSMHQAQWLRVEGPLGTSQVEVGPRGARVAASPCANQLCVRQGWIRRQGEIVACLPNRLMLRIAAGPDRPEVDAVTR